MRNRTEYANGAFQCKSSVFAFDEFCYKNNCLSKCIGFSAAFSLQEKGAKKKLTKRNAVRGISPVATDEEGFEPSTPQAFEKA